MLDPLILRNEASRDEERNPDKVHADGLSVDVHFLVLLHWLIFALIPLVFFIYHPSSHTLNTYTYTNHIYTDLSHTMRTIHIFTLPHYLSHLCFIHSLSQSLNSSPFHFTQITRIFKVLSFSI